MLVIRVLIDEDNAVSKATVFYKIGILPELLGKWYSRAPTYPTIVTDLTQDESSACSTSSMADCWCFCRNGEYGKMVLCDSSNCAIQWFHIDCLKLAEVPKGKWYCPVCTKAKRRKRQSKK